MAVAKAAESRLGEFSAQNLANTAGAFATVGQLDEALFAALARTATLFGELNWRDLANTAWAFATASHLAEALFATLAWVA